MLAEGKVGADALSGLSDDDEPAIDDVEAVVTSWPGCTLDTAGELSVEAAGDGTSGVDDGRSLLPVEGALTAAGGGVAEVALGAAATSSGPLDIADANVEIAEVASADCVDAVPMADPGTPGFCRFDLVPSQSFLSSWKPRVLPVVERWAMRDCSLEDVEPLATEEDKLPNPRTAKNT